MFRDREQRVAVVKTLFGAFNHAAWMTDDGLSEEACAAVRNLKEGKPTGLSHSAEWMFQLGVSLWDGYAVKMAFGKFYLLDARNRKIVFGLLACFTDWTEQSSKIEAWLERWKRLRA